MVATGGGVVLARLNWGYMQHAVVVWLRGSPELLAKRVVGDGTSKRPLMANGAEVGSGPSPAAGNQKALLVQSLPLSFHVRSAVMKEVLLLGACRVSASMTPLSRH